MEAAESAVNFASDSFMAPTCIFAILPSASTGFALAGAALAVAPPNAGSGSRPPWGPPPCLRPC
eukprot:8170453-Pyramimonas_sp.AAC.1